MRPGRMGQGKKNARIGAKKMERETGVEPATSSLGSWHSTTELLPLVTNEMCPKDKVQLL